MTGLTWPDVIFYSVLFVAFFGTMCVVAIQARKSMERPPKRLKIEQPVWKSKTTTRHDGSKQKPQG